MSEKKEKKSADEQSCIVLEGNLSEGFRARGPYANFDEATAATDYGSETWIMTLEEP